MAEEKKTVPTPEAPPAPEPGAQGVIPGMEGPPPPENKVIDLSSVRAGAGQQQTGPAPEGGQEWEKPQEQPEQKPRRGRRPKNKEAPAQGGKPKRKGRPPKEEKQTPGGGGAGKAAKTATRGKAAGKPGPPKEEEPPPQPKDASRAEKEEIVYLDLDQLHPFQNHPFGVRDDMEMKGLVSSVQAGGVYLPALVRPREGGGYEIIAGHRRQRASELAGYKNMPCIVRNMTDDEAILATVKMFPAFVLPVVPVRVEKFIYGNIQKSDELVKRVEAGVLASVLNIHDGTRGEVYKLGQMLLRPAFGLASAFDFLAQGATIQALFVLVHFHITPILFYISGANMRTK